MILKCLSLLIRDDINLQMEGSQNEESRIAVRLIQIYFMQNCPKKNEMVKYS